MATVIERSGAWYVKYKDGTGKWKRVVTTAKSKAEAKRIGTELEQRSERERFGLETRPSDCQLSLGQLCEWWLESRCPQKSQYIERKRLEKHVINSKLGETPLKVLTAGHVEDYLRTMEKIGLGPASLNGLRGTLFTVFSRARKAKKWTGPNPIHDVESRRIPKKVHQTLKAEEVPLLLDQVPDDWLNLFATAVYTGMRKGELFGLRKTDVDLALGLIVVARSYDSDTTKGGHQDIIPIAEPLVPYLKVAIASSRSEYVFPMADGSMRHKELDPQKVLRHALARAGLVERYDHVCRRCRSRGTSHIEAHADARIRECPHCKMKLWPRAVPRQMRFHDIRHSTATLLLRAGVDLHRVQRILRHKDVTLTTDTYGHLQVEDLRAAVNTLPFSSAMRGEVVDGDYEILHSVASETTQFGPPVVQPLGFRKNKGPDAKDFSNNVRAFNQSGRQDLNLRPLGPEPSALPG